MQIVLPILVPTISYFFTEVNFFIILFRRLVSNTKLTYQAEKMKYVSSQSKSAIQTLKSLFISWPNTDDG